MKTPDFKCEKNGRALRLELYDQIGPSWAGMIDARSVARAVRDAGEVDVINVHINSPGGSVFEGVAIHNMLKDHDAKVHIVVDGVAASIASLIAMAGDTIRIPKNALLMIHNPSAIAYGEQGDMQKTADLLGKIKSQLVDTYAERSKKKPEDVARMMDDETWMTGTEAVESGFADTATSDIKVTSSANAVVAEALTSLYRRVPENFSALAALSAGNHKKEPEKMATDVKTPDEIAAELKAKQDAEAADLKAKADAATLKAQTDERQRSADISALCAKAGKPDLASKLIADGATIADVNAQLVNVLCSERKPIDDDAETQVATADPGAAYKAEYAKEAAAYKKAGVSQEEYVAMRRVDDGLDALAAGSAAK